MPPARRAGRPQGTGVGPDGLTPRQSAVLRVVEEAVAVRGYPPSMREIGERAGLASTSSVAHQLASLERLGLLRRDPNRPRTYVPSRRGKARTVAGQPVGVDAEGLVGGDGAGGAEVPGGVRAPLLGRIAAGTPITAEGFVDDVLVLPTQLVGNQGEFFVLQVAGDSMAGPDGRILDGDLVVVRRQQAADEGEIVAAMIDGEATVKRLHREGSRVQLLPDNPLYPPIPGEEATILGRVVAVMRSLR